MDALDKIIQIESQRNLNEADVRYQIIDVVLKDIFHWPLDSVSCEKQVYENRADYVLNRKNNTPALVIEAKRESFCLNLPHNTNVEKTYQKIIVEKLLSDQNIKNAICQVKEYCEDLGSSFGGITNGKEWIFFHVNPQNKPWKKIPAFVIKNNSFFRDEYTYAFNIFGYNNIVEKNSLRRHISQFKTYNEEIFYPKNSIITYDTPVNSNVYAHILTSISRKYLGPIPIGDNDFMSKCYVTNKGYYDDLQKNVQGCVYDSLTPYFKRQGVSDFYDDKKGGVFAKKVQEIINKENLDNVMILFGGRGSGKSTFLKRFFYYIRPKEIERYAQVSIVDLLNSAQDSDCLIKEIWDKVRVSIDVDNVCEKDKEELIKLFDDEYGLLKKQLLKGLDEASVDYHRIVVDFIIKKKDDVKYVCERLSYKLKKRGKGLIIIIDNLDQFSPLLQDVCFLTATEIAKKLSCLVIISMREERFYRIKTKGVLDAYNPHGFHLTSPVIPDVVNKRLCYILNKINNNECEDFHINELEYNCVVSFLKICEKEIYRKDSELSTFLRYSTHGDVRMALDFFKGFITSGYTNINEMSPHPHWRFQKHQVIKPMMIPDRFFYDERLSKIPNVFQLRCDVNSSHFSGLRILDMLSNKSLDKSSNGFLDARYIVQKLDEEYNLKEDAEKYLDLFLSHGLLESSNRLEEYNQNVDQIKITAFGKYLLENLALDFTYLDLVSLDCGIFDESIHNRFVRDASRELDLYYENKFLERIDLRLNRVETFITYLIEQENKEILELNLNGLVKKYSDKIKESFTIQRTKIENSARRKQQNQNNLKGYEMC